MREALNLSVILDALSEERGCPRYCTAPNCLKLAQNGHREIECAG